MRETKRAYGWPEDAQFLVPDGVLRALRRRASASAAPSSAPPGWRSSAPTGGDPRPRRPRSSAQQKRELPDGWDNEISHLPRRRRRASPRREASQQVLNAIAQARALADRRLGRPHRLDLMRLTFDGAGDFEPGDLRRTQPPLRHPRARDRRRSATGCRCPSCARSGRASSSSPTTPARRSASRRSWRSRSSTSSPTTRSASARTARPTSRSSSSPRCARSPALDVIRPADANEVVEAWRVHHASCQHEPVVLVLTRQNLPDLRSHEVRLGRGPAPTAPTCWPIAEDGKPEVILIATGSEVSAGVAAHEELQRGGDHGSRVVSMPCWELFDRQPKPSTATRCCRLA